MMYAALLAAAAATASQTTPTPDIVAEQLRLTIERTEDAALQRKLRSAYLHYLGCLSNTPPMN